MPAIAREHLREHLVATRLAGSGRTPAWDVLRKAELVAAGDPEHCFGLSGMSRYSRADVLAEVTRQFGWTHTPGEPSGGPTFIEPDLVLDELDRAGERLAQGARGGRHGGRPARPPPAPRPGRSACTSSSPRACATTAPSCRGRATGSRSSWAAGGT